MFLWQNVKYEIYTQAYSMLYLSKLEKNKQKLQGFDLYEALK